MFRYIEFCNQIWNIECPPRAVTKTIKEREGGGGEGGGGGEKEYWNDNERWKNFKIWNLKW